MSDFTSPPASDRLRTAPVQGDSDDRIRDAVFEEIELTVPEPTRAPEPVWTTVDFADPGPLAAATAAPASPASAPVSAPAFVEVTVDAEPAAVPSGDGVAQERGPGLPAFESLDAPVKRYATPDVPTFPFAAGLEAALLPNTEGIVERAVDLAEF